MSVQEKRRLIALQEYSNLDKKTENAFDHLTKMAAQICDVSASQINFLGENWQWAQATTGWGPTELKREIGVCKHHIQSKDQFMIVEDTLQDERFIDNPLVKEDPPLRFYAGITLKSEDDHPLGTLCVYDSEPKQLSGQQLESLQFLANEVETHLKLLADQDLIKERLLQASKFNQKVIDSLPGIFFIYNERGELVRWNDRVPQITGYSEQELIQMQPLDCFDNEDQKLVLQNIAKVFQSGKALFETCIIAKDGSSLPLAFNVTSFEMDNESYLLGIGQNHLN